MELQLPIEIYPESEFRVTKILQYAGRVDAYHFELDGQKYFVHEEFHHKPHVHMISVGRKDIDGSYDRDKHPHIQVDEFVRLELPYGQPLAFHQTRTAVLGALEEMGVVKFCDSSE